MRETEVAAVVVAWLTSEGWDVYQEVDGIDVVATSGPLVCAIEVKVRMSWEVCEQAVMRRNHAHLVWVAVGAKRVKRNYYSRVPWYAKRALERDGIGIMSVRMDRGDVTMVQAPALNRAATDGARELRSRLRPQHKTHCAAGSPSGGGWTPFKDTCHQLLKLVDALEYPEDGIPVKDAIGRIDHHYRGGNSAARSALVRHAERGVVPGVAIKRDGRRLLFVREASRA